LLSTHDLWVTGLEKTQRGFKYVIWGGSTWGPVGKHLTNVPLNRKGGGPRKKEGTRCWLGVKKQEKTEKATALCKRT